MWQNHHEEITTRQKASDQQTHLLEKEVQFNNCKAFLYTLKAHRQIEDDKLSLKTSTLNLLNSKVSIEEIKRIVNNTIQAYEKSNETLNDKDECKFTCMYNIILIFDCFNNGIEIIFIININKFTSKYIRLFVYVMSLLRKSFNY